MFPYKWMLSSGYPSTGIPAHNRKVFGTFLCGGGSTMGYKLAGYHHLGGVEIDPQMAHTYNANHSPEHLYCEDIRVFNNRDDLPAVLYELDILDGSPPCTTFSLSGDREQTWGKKKKFNEGQTEQVLDDLVFEYCNTIIKLQPKVAVLENVKGIILGNAKWYTKRVIKKLDSNGYEVQVFLLNSVTMGVPQRRERVFFIARRKELKLPQLVLSFNERPIPFREVIDWNDTSRNLSDRQYKLWLQRIPSDNNFGDIMDRLYNRTSMFNNTLFHANKVANTLTSAAGGTALFDIPRRINREEALHVSSFPQDYNFAEAHHLYVMGMSVPPVMMAQLSYQIYQQWFRQ